MCPTKYSTVEMTVIIEACTSGCWKWYASKTWKSARPFELFQLKSIAYKMKSPALPFNGLLDSKFRWKDIIFTYNILFSK